MSPPPLQATITRRQKYKPQNFPDCLLQNLLVEFINKKYNIKKGMLGQSHKHHKSIDKFS